jgi:hypothetical protein
LVSFGGGEEQGRMDLGNGPVGVEGDGDVSGRSGVREFSEGEDVEVVVDEEGGEECSAEGLDGGANGAEWVSGILHQGMPSGAGEANLVREAAHELNFLGEGQIRVCVVCAWKTCMSRGKQKKE